MNVSGKTTSRAPACAASRVTCSSLSSVPARSRTTGSAWTQATLTVSRTTPSLLRGSDLVTDGDLAAREDVGAQAASMDEPADDPRLRHALEEAARLAELDAEALGLAHAEACPDEHVHVDSAGEHVASALGGPEPCSHIAPAHLE